MSKVSAPSPKVIAAAEKSARRRSIPGSSPAVNGLGNVPNAVGSKVIKSSSSSSKKRSFSSKQEAIAKKRQYYRVEVVRKQFFEVDVRYQNLAKIGSGAYGLVCSATDTVTGREVAIKKVADVFDDLVDAKRILREIKLLQHFAQHGRHENVVNLIDVMTGPPHAKRFHDLYMVFDHHECDMDNIIKSDQNLSEAHAQYFLYQILKGLKYLHSAGILHRDLKPANLLVNSNCDLVICDFGLARARGVHDDQMTEYVVTRYYRAPELLCEAPYDARIDVWSAGLIFCEIMLRRVILRGSNTIDQIHKIVELLGVPSADDLSYIPDPSVRRSFARMVDRPDKRLERRLKAISPLAMDLISKMLTFDPRKRISVEEALEHPFFEPVHEELGTNEPDCPALFDASFEKDFPLVVEMPKSLLRRYMYTVSIMFVSIALCPNIQGRIPFFNTRSCL
jgi:mitogen-activated protein kinase 1/3